MNNGNNNNAAAAQNGGDNKGVTFRLETILVKNVSMEMPENIVAPVFDGGDNNVQFELRNTSRALSEDNLVEVSLDATVRVRGGEETQLLIEVTQAGVFHIANASEEQRQMLVNIHAAELLYPYMSQLVSDLMARAGAPRVFLPPFNFKALYEQKRRAAAQRAAQKKEGAA